MLALIALMLATPVSLAVTEGSKLWVEGDSSAHTWKCEAAAFNGAGEATAAEAVPTTLTAFELGVPVKQLKCGNGTMEGKLQDALNAEKNPRIEFTMTSAKPAEGGAIEVLGKLTIAGKERTVRSLVTISQEGGKLVATGALPMKMSDFGVKPPTAMLGMLKTHDAVTVRFALRALALPTTHASN
jgi:polyisoprenoid-binding protein YceI